MNHLRMQIQIREMVAECLVELFQCWSCGTKSQQHRVLVLFLVLVSYDVSERLCLKFRQMVLDYVLVYIYICCFLFNIKL